MITTPLADGVIDVHAHWIPRELFGLPGSGPHGEMHDRDGELYLGDLPLSIATSSMSDVSAIRADMARADVGVRVLSAPPFAFPLETGSDADAYVGAFNASLTDVVAGADGALLGLGHGHARGSGVGDRPVGGVGEDRGHGRRGDPAVGERPVTRRSALHHVLGEAARLDLAVLVHPMQLPRPEWSEYYLTNLIGNPVESATAVASLVLSGIKDELPGLRICFVHGGGCAPGLLGRWTHGWTMRADVRSATTRPPAEAFGELYFDTVTHDPHQLELLCELAGADKVVCGSDYPFDMAESDPARFAVDHGPGRAGLITAAMAYLGLPTKES